MAELIIIIPAAVLIAMFLGGGRKRTRLRRTSPPDLPNENLHARVHKVIDGDTFDARVGKSLIRVRLAAIDCPEDDQAWGRNAKYGLIKLIGGKSIFVENHGEDVHGRLIGTIHVDDGQRQSMINVNEMMVLRGHAWVMRSFYQEFPAERKASLNRKERWARSKRAGLWGSDQPIPPWEWRKLNR